MLEISSKNDLIVNFFKECSSYNSKISCQIVSRTLSIRRLAHIKDLLNITRYEAVYTIHML